ncbi:MAG: PH domain-containing protein [Bacteroidales bacterium]|nr:PH domain-containing protein [Bacteroidales bacterium]
MGYVKENLLKGEEIKYTAHIHWAAFLPGIFWSLMAILATIFFGGESGLVFIPVIFWVFAAYRFCKGLFLKLFTECILTSSRIIYKYGFISRQTIELQLSRCEGVSVNQGLLGRILDYGTVVVTTGGPTNRFSVIADPVTFRNYINEQIDIVHTAKNGGVAKTDSLGIADIKPIQQPKSSAEEIKELSELLKQGLITEEEFKTMKNKIINHN